jgi:DNA excision repair protein ERCC-2
MSVAEYAISVRGLAAFCYQSGSIVSGFSSPDLEMGLLGHQAYQRAQNNDYLSEKKLTYATTIDAITLTIGGRADGIMPNETPPVLEELKTTSHPLNSLLSTDHPEYWAQAKCYAYFWCLDHDLDGMCVRLVYIDQPNNETRSFEAYCSLDTLDTFVMAMVSRYIAWLKLIQLHYTARDASIQSLTFPFADFRNGQRHFSVGVYKSIKENRHFFVQAPTGTGKTAAALFPAIKCLGEDLVSKVFYLTARNTTRETAEKHMQLLASTGLTIKTLTIYAKDKLCIMAPPNCHPKYCERAAGHFDRIQDALEDIYEKESHWQFDVITKYAEKHRVCPFEFCLDLSELADVVICDYNYVFDPRVALKRYFSAGPMPFCLLIDEAHNLVSRARTMFSAELTKQSFLDLRHALGQSLPSLKKQINKVNRVFLDERKKITTYAGTLVEPEPPEPLVQSLRLFSSTAENWLKRNIESPFRETLLTLYFETQTFLAACDVSADDFATIYSKYGSAFTIKLNCIDPARLLKQTMNKLTAAIFFSATLSPMPYYIDVLGGYPAAYRLALSSPFSTSNLCVMIAGNVNTRYKAREHSISPIINYTRTLIDKHAGNYLIFFPSYQYMEQFLDTLTHHPIEHCDMIVQSREMSESARQEFLSNFQTPVTSSSLLGCAVLGGIFGESIDLVGDKLTGAIIVGTGLPQIGVEQDLIQAYYNKEHDGFSYAYTFPGLNRVLQAAGRVIRSASDRGVLLLIDDRFLTPKYQSLLPLEWQHYLPVYAIDDCASILDEFWETH